MYYPRLDLSFVGDLSDCYPEDRMADAVEAKIDLTLPDIAGLTPGLTDEQRLTVLAATTAMERAAFVEIYDDPFGDEADLAAPRSGMSPDRIVEVDLMLTVSPARQFSVSVA